MVIFEVRQGRGMVVADEEPLTVLSTLIAQAEAHRVDQMLRIADLLSDDQPADEAERALNTIEGLLASMRAKRSMMISERARS